MRQEKITLFSGLAQTIQGRIIQNFLKLIWCEYSHRLYWRYWITL